MNVYVYIHRRRSHFEVVGRVGRQATGAHRRPVVRRAAVLVRRSAVVRILLWNLYLTYTQCVGICVENHWNWLV